MGDKARIAQHSTSAMAGAFARRLGAAQLVLTHFSCRFMERREVRLGDKAQLVHTSKGFVALLGLHAAAYSTLEQLVALTYDIKYGGIRYIHEVKVFRHPHEHTLVVWGEVVQLVLRIYL